VSMRLCAAVVLMWAQQSRVRTVIEAGLRRLLKRGKYVSLANQLFRHACNKLGHALQVRIVLCKVTL
jgi:hypothetical protein